MLRCLIELTFENAVKNIFHNSNKPNYVRGCGFPMSVGFQCGFPSPCNVICIVSPIRFQMDVL